MKLLLIVQEWISFYNQAESLSKGLAQLGIQHKVVRINDIRSSPNLYKEFYPDFVIGVGSWHSYEFFVERPKSFGIKVVPWIVSNGKIKKHLSGYNKLELILTPSEHCKTIFVRDGIREERIKVLPEAVEPNFWQTIPERKLQPFLNLLSISSSFPLLQKFDLLKIRREKIPLLLTIGGDATSKGAQEVIQALARLDRKIPWIYIIKTWPQAHTFKRSLEEFRLLKKFGLEDRIKYIMGEFSQEFIRGLINISDVYVAPSRGEGFGLPFVQVQMCEKPVITLRANSTRELVQEGETGFLVNSVLVGDESRANIPELAKVLEKLLVNPELRKKMGKKARTFATKKFCPEVIASELAHHLEQL